MNFRFYASANKRLDEIWQYTIERWDEEQAEKRYLWRPVKEEGIQGVYYFRYERHFIFFRELNGGEMGIISILHEQMDLPRRLKDDEA